jgi:hypothetical protein
MKLLTVIIITVYFSFVRREVANAWGCRVGQPDQPAPAKCVQSLFNDIELYPTKTQGKIIFVYISDIQ